MVTVYIAHQGRSSYMHSSIKSAISNNNDVVYIGDCDYVSSLIYSEDIYTPLEIDDLRFRKFCSTWTNYSLNDYEFELGCFRRFFYIYEVAKYRGDQEFWMADSDVLVFQDLNPITSFIRDGGFECALSSPKSEAPFFWASSPHFSYWTLNSLKAFLNFVEKKYTDGRQQLINKFKYHQENNIPGGVCDMTLLYLWINSNQVNVINLNSLKTLDFFIDHNMNTASNFLDGVAEYSMEPLLQIKKIVNKAGRSNVVEASGRSINILALHFQGGAKKYMRRVFMVKSTRPIFFIDILFVNCLKSSFKRLLRYLKLL